MATKTDIKIKPLSGYILIEPVEASEKTASGIFLPESAQEKQGQGRVVSIGAALYVDGKEMLSPVKVGDTVFYKKWGGDEIKVGSKEMKLVKFDEVMAIVE